METIVYSLIWHFAKSVVAIVKFVFALSTSTFSFSSIFQQKEIKRKV